MFEFTSVMEHSASAPTVGPSQAKSGAVDGSGAGGGAGSSGMIKSGSVATLHVKPGRVRGISFAKWAARRQKKRTQDAAWSEVWDEEQQVSYFYNSVTHETAWFDPRSTALAAAGTVIPDDDAANEGGHYDAAGYTENGFCPKPTLLGLARAEIEYEEKQAAEMEKQVDWVRVRTPVLCLAVYRFERGVDGGPTVTRHDVDVVVLLLCRVSCFSLSSKSKRSCRQRSSNCKMSWSAVATATTICPACSPHSEYATCTQREPSTVSCVTYHNVSDGGVPTCTEHHSCS